MTHPLRKWLKAKNKSVTEFCEGAPFSPPTVYHLLKGAGGSEIQTIVDISRQTGGEVTTDDLVKAWEARQGVQAQ